MRAGRGIIVMMNDVSRQGLGRAGGLRRRAAGVGLTVVVVVALFFFTASPALAQVTGRLPGKDAGVMQWVIGLGLALLICITAFINPKRTHQG